MDVFEDPDDKLEVFNLLFVDILDKHAPMRTIRVKKKPYPWITKAIRNEMDRRDRLFRFYRHKPSDAAWDIYVQGPTEANFDYFHHLLLKKPHPSALWQVLNQATSGSVHTDKCSSYSNATSIAENLNTHFASVSSNVITPPFSSSESVSLLQTHPPSPLPKLLQNGVGKLFLFL